MEPCPGNSCPDPGLAPKPRQHFDYFAPASMCIFVLMTGEWANVMDTLVSAVDGAAPVVFVAFVMLIGRYLLVNILIAMLLNTFADDTDISLDAPADEARSALALPVTETDSRAQRYSVRNGSIDESRNLLLEVHPTTTCS